ncbi:MAG: phenylalanine--tRNA ligase subunit beta [Gemmatimonadetes bacterium]|nr:phenylalanine--tRNA ligase subunit beta [Gemmatimonadota bacterium]
MNVSRRWLEAFLRRPLDLGDLEPRLAMLGLPADAIEPLHAGLRPVVVGVVAELVQHPNADRLKICQVDVGNGLRRQVVTGADNVALGRKYPFAPIGVTLPNGLTLEKRKLRGEVSEGMLCSPDEIGLGTEHDGLLTLETEAAPGTGILEVLELDDHRLVLDLSPMRGDLLGHKGIARELAASYRVTLRLPELPGVAAATPSPRRVEADSATLSNGLVIAVEPETSCRRFTAAVIAGVRVGPSPQWLVRRLAAVGQRSINNLVDITNYVMLELGQPLHAYDAAALRGSRLSARLATAGERLTTLDGVDRAMPSGATVVADGAGAVGAAGIMGGRDSEVVESTTTVVLEAAWWEPSATRRTRKALGLVSEASHRFERGTDLWGVPDALRRAADLTVAIAGGSLVDAVDVWPSPTNPPRIFVRQARVAQIVGLDMPMTGIEQALVAIGATVSPKPEDGRLAVDVPGWRRDLTTEIDLIEEVARIHGYDRLPDEVRPYRPGRQTDARDYLLAGSIRQGIVAEGLFEVVSLSLGPSGGADAVTVVNPLSAEHRYLRDALMPGLVRHVESNWAAQVRDVRLFEIGTVFGKAGSTADRPSEQTRVAGVLTGNRAPAHWTDHGHSAEVDWWDLKAVFERAVSLANPGARVQVEGGQLVAVAEGGPVGWAGPVVADRPPWAAPLFGFEVEVAEAERVSPKFVPQRTLPAAARDLALVVGWGTSATELAEGMRRAAGTLLESTAVVDEYRDPSLPPGTRSVAFRLIFRGRDRTLKDTEVDHAVTRIQAAVEKQFGATLRRS